VQIFSEAVEQAKAFGAPDDLIEEYEAILEQIRKANSESRGAYNKPVILLTDDLSASAADMFAAVFQDSWRGPIFGWRTMGLGGSVGSFSDATTYSEGTIGITWTQLSRPNRVSHLGYPSTNYIENVGIHPDIRYDSQTRENLMNGYMPYVEAFTNAMLDHIQASQ
jgi:C-terminal processing protease CtpA/Prc